MPRVAVTAIAAGLALGAASPALGAHLSPSVTAAPRGTTLLMLGTGFAPPNEFCSRPAVTVDGRPATVTGRISDDAGGWAIRIRVTQAPGSHVAVMAQRCESGRDGSKRTISARAPFRALR